MRIAIIIGILLLAVAGVVWWQYNVDDDTLVPQKSAVADESTVPNDWVNYTSTGLGSAEEGYTIQHPSHMKVSAIATETATAEGGFPAPPTYTSFRAKVGEKKMKNSATGKVTIVDDFAPIWEIYRHWYTPFNGYIYYSKEGVASAMEQALEGEQWRKMEERLELDGHPATRIAYIDTATANILAEVVIVGEEPDDIFVIRNVDPTYDSFEVFYHSFQP